MAPSTTEHAADTSAAPAARPGTSGRRAFADLHSRDLGLLAIRIVVGITLIGHGGQKLFGWFGGDGLDGTARFFESAGYSPGKVFAVLGGLAEFGGGIALLLGLATSLAGAALTATLAGATAVSADGSNNAFFAMDNGYELPLLLTVLALGLTLTGAGRLALDSGRPWDRGPIRYGLALLGVAGALVAVLIR